VRPAWTGDAVSVPKCNDSRGQGSLILGSKRGRGAVGEQQSFATRRHHAKRARRGGTAKRLPFVDAKGRV